MFLAELWEPSRALRSRKINTLSLIALASGKTSVEVLLSLHTGESIRDHVLSPVDAHVRLFSDPCTNNSRNDLLGVLVLLCQ